MKRNLQKGILVTSACAAFLLGNVQQAYAVAADASRLYNKTRRLPVLWLIKTVKQ